MAHVLNDRVKETTTSTGTGTINLAGAVTGFETFVAGIANSNTTYYAIVHQSANEWEVGTGTVTDADPDTLSRTPISSSNSDSAVDFSAGTKDVFCTLPASVACLNNALADNDVRHDSLGIGTNASGTTGEIRATNNITAYYSSDRRLKENIQIIPDPIRKLLNIDGVFFDWTDDYINTHGGEDSMFLRKKDVGVIAQQVEEVLPMLVADRPDGYKAVRYEKIIPLLIEAIKEQQIQIDELNNENNKT